VHIQHTLQCFVVFVAPVATLGYIATGCLPCRDYDGGKTSLDCALSFFMKNNMDGMGRLKVYLACSESIFPGDAKKVGIVLDRLRMFSQTVDSHCAIDVHAQVLVWQPHQA
jgi:hypothetical protein